MEYERIIPLQILSCSYWVIFFTCILLLFFQCYFNPRTKFKQSLFFILLMILSISKASFWSVVSVYDIGEKSGRSFWFFLWWESPSLILITTFSLLISYWAKKYHSFSRSNNQGFNRAHNFLLIFFNAIVYIFQFGLLVYYQVASEKEKDFLNLLQPYFKAFLYILLFVFVIIYGSLISCNSGEETISNHVRKRIKRIVITTVFIAFVFLVRIIHNLTVPWIPELNQEWEYYWIAYTIYYTLVEVVPVIMVISAITQLPRNMRPKKKSIVLLSPTASTLYDDDDLFDFRSGNYGDELF
eukprot:TRINITY_DN3020_c0_g1_i2.p1 TRINITY_DN3020_c0_g1~~TRINITY_DN3020_c0_g1_i2.p1  ORF type:complete len:298 (+),score=39.96 TRINITY_DN3020_c0_g1_i2:25-918(+)